MEVFEGFILTKSVSLILKEKKVKYSTNIHQKRNLYDWILNETLPQKHDNNFRKSVSS